MPLCFWLEKKLLSISSTSDNPLPDDVRRLVHFDNAYFLLDGEGNLWNGIIAENCITLSRWASGLSDIAASYEYLFAISNGLVLRWPRAIGPAEIVPLEAGCTRCCTGPSAIRVVAHGHAVLVLGAGGDLWAEAAGIFRRTGFPAGRRVTSIALGRDFGVAVAYRPTAPNPGCPVCDPVVADIVSPEIPVAAQPPTESPSASSSPSPGPCPRGHSTSSSAESLQNPDDDLK